MTTAPTSTRLLDNYVGGRWVPSTSSEALDVTNPASGEVLARKSVKVTHDSLDEAIESLGPRLEYSVDGGDVSVSLEFTEFDDFQPDPRPFSSRASVRTALRRTDSARGSSGIR